MADVVDMAFEIRDKLEEVYTSFIDSGEDKVQRMLAVVLAVKRINDHLGLVWAANGLFSPSKESESTSAPLQSEPEVQQSDWTPEFGDLVTHRNGEYVVTHPTMRWGRPGISAVRPRLFSQVTEETGYIGLEKMFGLKHGIALDYDADDTNKFTLKAKAGQWHLSSDGTVVLTPKPEPKTEAPQFKEGDAVRISDYCDELYLPPQIVGAEGMVEEADRPNGNILVSVAKGYGNGMTWAVPPKCLELLPKPTALEINGQPYTVPEGYRVCGDDELWQEGMVYSHDTEGEPWYDTYRPTVSKEVCSKRDVATIKSKYMNKGGVILAPVTSKPVVK